jgi:hypothetical protein
MVEEAFFLKAEDTIFLKKAIAIKLYSNKIEQSKISKILNLTQPMVSNYCNSKENIPKEINDLADNISKKITNGNSTNFHTCVTFSANLYKGKYYIAEKAEVINDENKEITNNLIEAFLLLKGKDICELIPKVKINIAMAKQKAVDSEDVAAFLNGLIIADDKITNNNGIRFGKSKHLSSLLIYLKNYIEINAIMNVAYIKNIEKTSFSYSNLTKDFKFKDRKKDVDILLHDGDFGIEPCAYILGKDAIDVVNKFIKLIEELK